MRPLRALQCALSAAAAASGAMGGAPLVVDVRWSDPASQFLLAENLTASDGPPAAELWVPGDSAQLEHGSGTPAALRANVSRFQPMNGWKLLRVGAAPGATLRVAAAREGSRFRAGFVQRSAAAPGEWFYREWMVDSSGSWVAAGVPDATADLESDAVWGTFGTDGWAATSQVDLQMQEEGLRFEAPDERALTMSLDGFAQLAGDAQVRENVAVKQSLLINEVQFDFEIANFGPELPVGRAIASKLVLAEPLDACKPLRQPMRDKVMFAIRGGCDFLDKVLHAQRAGALAVVVADKLYAKHDELAHELVIMDQVGRSREAELVTIPSVFVSTSAHRYVLAQSKAKEALRVALNGPVYAPAHHGAHWRETGLTPAVWLAPGSRVQVSLVGPAAPEGDEERCRPVTGMPLARSERIQLLHKVALDKASLEWLAMSRNAADKASQAVSLFSKRLVARTEACGPAAVGKDERFSWLSPVERLDNVLPWAAQMQAGDGILSDLTVSGAGRTFSEGWVASALPIGADIIPDSRCARLASATYEPGLEAYRLVAANVTGRRASCSFVYSLVDEASGMQAPAVGLFNSAFRAPLKRFWHIGVRSAGEKVVGVITPPLRRGGAGIWAVDGTDRPIADGKRLQLAGARWTDYLGLLLDLKDGTVTFFTSPSHSRWVTMVLPRGPGVALGVVPFASLSAGASILFHDSHGPAYADRIHYEMRSAHARATCSKAAASVTACSVP